MRRLSPSSVFLAAALVLPAVATAQSKRAITVDDLLALHRVSDPQIAPDGSRVVYTVATPDRQANRVARNLWIVPTAGGTPRQLTFTGRDGGARWSPDGSRLAFLSSRDGAQQIYLLNLTGGEPTKLTSLDGGADQIVWAPDGKTLAFTSSVWPDCADDACNKRKTEGKEKDQVKARTYDGLLYRHWTAWGTGQRSHLFTVAVGGGTPRDLTPGAGYDVPPVQREGPHPIAFSPDGSEIAFVAVTDAMEAISTNGDIFVVKADGTQKAPTRITDNPAFDGAPAYSPDGKWIAYRAQSRPGNEADRWRLMKYDRQAKTHTEVAPGLRPQRQPAGLDARQPDHLLQRGGLGVHAGISCARRRRDAKRRDASDLCRGVRARCRRQDAGHRPQQPAGASRTGGGVSRLAARFAR